MPPGIDPALLIALLLAFGVLDPDAFLGELMFPVISLGVAVILFEGRLTLRLSSRGEQGALIAGSNKVALMIGMTTFYGSPLSEHADRCMDLTGFSTLMAVSRNAEANAMICARYRHEFGPDQTFSIRAGNDDPSDQRKTRVSGLRTDVLFGEDVSWSKLASLVGQGAVVKFTGLSEQYDFEAFSTSQGKEAVNLFALDEKGILQVFSARKELVPGPGWKIVSPVVEKTG
jgi:hypothetical protein